MSPRTEHTVVSQRRFYLSQHLGPPLVLVSAYLPEEQRSIFLLVDLVELLLEQREPVLLDEQNARSEPSEAAAYEESVVGCD